MKQSRQIENIAVLGAGSWGTALANVAARAGRNVYLWGRDPVHVQSMIRERENIRHLPGIGLEDKVSPESDIGCVAAADAVLLVVPAQAQRGVAALITSLIPAAAPVVICAKGIERETRMFLAQVIGQALPDSPVAILSGPSFAQDVAKGLPTAVTLASDDLDLAQEIASALGTANFRLYHSDDVRGVEIGGAAKNVLAIACGIAAGQGLGASANAALVARGFAELRRFGEAFGAKSETLMGLSGLGDLVLTCGSAQSRNFAFGLSLGQGKPVAEAGGGKLAEGLFTAGVLVAMVRASNVELPICEAVNGLLEGELDIRSAINSLLSRPQRSEI